MEAQKIDQHAPACNPSIDRALIANGYEPIACIGKQPVARAWQSRPNTIEGVEAERAAHPGATNTGLRTGAIAAIDSDLRDPVHHVVIERLMVEMLGQPGMRRVGAKGAISCYRNPTPAGKITVSDQVTGEDGKRKRRTLVEVLGTGQQFVAYGDHPDTGKPYTWPDADILGQEPLQTPLIDLPEASTEKLQAFAERAAEALSRLGYSDVRVSGGHVHADERKLVRVEQEPVPLDYLERMLTHVPPDCGRDPWIACLGGIALTNLAGLPEGDDVLRSVAQYWSSGGYCGATPANWAGDEDVAYQFDTMKPQRPDNKPVATFGTLYHIACRNGWTEPAPNRERDRPAEEKYGPQTEGDDGGPQQINGANLDDARIDGEWTCYAAPLADIAAVPPPFLIPRHREKGLITYDEGGAGVGKSYINQQEAAAISSGFPIYGEPVEQADVFYLNYEEPQAEFERRLYHIRRFDGIDTSRLRVRHLRHKEGAHLLRVRRDGAIIITRFGRQVFDAIARHPVHAYIVFDGLIDAILFEGGTRNEDEIVRQVISWLDRQSAELNFTGSAIIHPSRTGERTDTASYAPAWSTKPRAINIYRRLHLEGRPARVGDPPSMTYTRRIAQKRSHGVPGHTLDLQFSPEANVFLPLGGGTRGGESPLPVAVELAARYAGMDIRIKRDGTLGPERTKLTTGHALMTEYRQRTGQKLSVEHFLETLGQAEQMGALRYIEGSHHGHVRAGYEVNMAEPAPDLYN